MSYRKSRSYILPAVTNGSTVQCIYCLNRSCDAADREAAGNSIRGLPGPLDPPGVVFSQADLGLAPDMHGSVPRG